MAVDSVIVSSSITIHSQHKHACCCCIVLPRLPATMEVWPRYSRLEVKAAGPFHPACCTFVLPSPSSLRSLQTLIKPPGVWSKLLI